jgi:hypothetical protein
MNMIDGELTVNMLRDSSRYAVTITNMEKKNVITSTSHSMYSLFRKMVPDRDKQEEAWPQV